MVITAQTALLHFHPLHFQSCSAGKRTVFCGSGNCDLSASLKHIAQKREVLHLMEMVGTCAGVREKVMDAF